MHTLDCIHEGRLHRKGGCPCPLAPRPGLAMPKSAGEWRSEACCGSRRRSSPSVFRPASCRQPPRPSRPPTRSTSRPRSTRARRCSPARRTPSRPQPVAFDPTKNMLQAHLRRRRGRRRRLVLVRPDPGPAVPERRPASGAADPRPRRSTCTPTTPRHSASRPGPGERRRRVRLPPAATTGTVANLYTIAISGRDADRDDRPADPVPELLHGAYSPAPACRCAEKKFITYNNVAVTELTRHQHRRRRRRPGR